MAGLLHPNRWLISTASLLLSHFLTDAHRFWQRLHLQACLFLLKVPSMSEFSLLQRISMHAVATHCILCAFIHHSPHIIKRRRDPICSSYSLLSSPSQLILSWRLKSGSTTLLTRLAPNSHNLFSAQVIRSDRSASGFPLLLPIIQGIPKYLASLASRVMCPSSGDFFFFEQHLN